MKDASDVDEATERRWRPQNERETVDHVYQWQATSVESI